MADPEATAAARAMNRQRWRGQHVVRCADTAVSRIGELPDQEVARLAHYAAEEVARRAAVAKAEGAGG